jgi:Ca2+/Na+ antiporter
MKQNAARPLFPVILLFVLLNAFFISGRTLLEKWSIDREVLIVGNLILFVVTLLSFWLGQRGLRSGNVQAFIRSIYASFIVKFFIIAVAAFIYIVAVKKNVNRPALIACMCLYLVYTFLEVSILMKMAKEKKNE